MNTKLKCKTSFSCSVVILFCNNSSAQKLRSKMNEWANDRMNLNCNLFVAYCAISPFYIFSSIQNSANERFQKTFTHSELYTSLRCGSLSNAMHTFTDSHELILAGLMLSRLNAHRPSRKLLCERCCLLCLRWENIVKMVSKWEKTRPTAQWPDT